MDLKQEEARLNALIQGLTVRRAMRSRRGEVMIEFTDGTRLYCDARSDAIELSVTGGDEDTAD